MEIICKNSTAIIRKCIYFKIYINLYECVFCHVHLFATLWSVACLTPLVPGILQARTAVGSHFLLLGIFLTLGLKPGLLHCRWILCPLSHQGSLGINNIILWRREWLPTPVFLPGEFQGQRGLELQSIGLQRVGHD